MRLAEILHTLYQFILLNFSWIKICLFLRNIESLRCLNNLDKHGNFSDDLAEIEILLSGGWCPHMVQQLCGYGIPFMLYLDLIFITKTCLFKYIENFISKTENFQIKISDIFHISAQNIDFVRTASV